MRLPIQAEPVIRDRFLAQWHETAGVTPQHRAIGGGMFCGICKDHVQQFMGGMATLGCTGVETAFDFACNASMDWIPFLGEGPAEGACMLGGIAIGTLCDKYGASWLATAPGVSAICSAMGLC